MLKDLSDQKKLEKELVLAAIQALKAKGQEVNAYTVADEAKISRSILYRNSELMELIAQGRGASSSSTDDLLRRIEELETRNRELEEQIWEIEKVAESQHQEAWKKGYQAGMDEAVKRLADHQARASELPETAASHTETGETIPFNEKENGGNGHQAPHHLEEFEEEPGSTMVGSVAFARQESLTVRTQDNPPLIVESESLHAEAHAEPQEYQQEAAQAQEAEVEEEQPAPAAPAEPVHVQEEIAPAIEAQPVSAHVQAEAPSVASAPKGQWSKDGIYNAARSGPYAASNYNPLVELSWKDLETVYNFSVASLKDYAKNLPPPRDVIAAQPMPDTQYPNEESMRRQEEAATEAAPPPEPRKSTSIYSQLDFDHPTDSIAETEEQNDSQDKFARPQEADAANQDPNRTADRLEAMDPRMLDNVLDLDALDIFDDLDEYVDIDKIDVIQDVEIPQKQQEEEEPQDPDALRNLIRDRIQQANEVASGPATPLMTPQGQGADAGKPAAAASRSKFVGGKAQQEAAPPPAAPFVIKQLPAEIRKACLILGIRPEEMTQQIVMDSWKRQIASPGVHPDQGGDHEAAIYLNTAKDTLVRWLDAQAPKLGKKFGGKDQKQPERKPDKRRPEDTDPGANKQ